MGACAPTHPFQLYEHRQCLNWFHTLPAPLRTLSSYHSSYTSRPRCTGRSDVAKLIERIDVDVMEAQDNLLLAKTQQALHADRARGPEIVYKVGDQVLLSTFHRRREYMQRGDRRVAKFMVRFDSPYTVLQAWPDSSVYTLDLPPHDNTFPTFHSSLLRPFVRNDNALFPSRAHQEPGPIVTANGEEEWTVERILDRRKRGRGFQYLVRWLGYGPEHDTWLAGSRVEDLEALDVYLRENGLPGVDDEAEVS